MTKNKKKSVFGQYKKYLKKDPKLLKIMRQLRIDQESYFGVLYLLENNKIIPDKIYTDSTFQK